MKIASIALAANLAEFRFFLYVPSGLLTIKCIFLHVARAQISSVFVVILFSLISRLLNSYTFKNDDISDIF